MLFTGMTPAGIAASRHVVRSIDQPAWILGPRGQIVSINADALRTFGYRSDDDVLGTCSHATFHHHRVNGQHFERDCCPLVNSTETVDAADGTGLPTRQARHIHGQACGAHGADWFIRRTDVPVPVRWSTSPLELDSCRTHLVTLRVLDDPGSDPTIGRTGARDSVLHHRALHQDACDLIEARCADPELSPQSVARALHVSLRLLQMAFSKAGDSPAGRIRTTRLERAAQLLRDGVTVTDVVTESGFADPSTFRRAFRRHFGAPPSTLRPSART